MNLCTTEADHGFDVGHYSVEASEHAAIHGWSNIGHALFQSYANGFHVVGDHVQEEIVLPFLAAGFLSPRTRGRKIAPPEPIGDLAKLELFIEGILMVTEQVPEEFPFLAPVAINRILGPCRVVRPATPCERAMKHRKPDTLRRSKSQKIKKNIVARSTRTPVPIKSSSEYHRPYPSAARPPARPELGDHWTLETIGIKKPPEFGNHWSLVTTRIWKPMEF